MTHQFASAGGKYGKAMHFHDYQNGNVRVVTGMKTPLPWGARVWVEIEE